MIRAEKLTKIYPNGVVALKDLDLTIEKGEFVFVVGPTGAGKSTLLKLIIKETEPTSGRLLVAGKDVSRLSPWKVPYLRRSIGCVFQDFKLLPHKTAYENVAFAMEATGAPEHVIRKAVPEALELVGLGSKMQAFPHQLSGGEQQRVSIARAFVNRPPILLADEPTGNLDPETSLEIVRLLHQINRLGSTVVVATHDHAAVDAMRKRVVELEEGKLVRDQERGVYGYVS